MTLETNPRLEAYYRGSTRLVQCMGGWCKSREGCAHYWSEPIGTHPPSERLCEQGNEEPVRVLERDRLSADPRFAEWAARVL